LFQNLRSTRETELADEFPLQAVCAWIGNSQPVAAKHYLQLTDERFDRAAGISPNEIAAKCAAERARTDGHGDERAESEDAKTPENTGLFATKHFGSQSTHARERTRTSTPFGTGT
jgi:hypothetical protein